MVRSQFSLMHSFRQARHHIFVVFMFTAFSLFSSAAAADDDVSLSASLSTTDLPIDGSATFVITVNGARSADVQLPEVENLVFHRRGQSSQMQIINGSFSSSITTTYIVEPLATGEYTIPALKVTAQNRTLTTDPLTLRVHDSTPKPQPTMPRGAEPPQQQPAFLAISTIKEKAYTGELIPVEIKAYFLRGIRAEVLQLPKIRGEAFVITPLDNNPQQTLENFEGRQYSVITWKSTISPIKEGRYDLIIDLGATLLLPKRGNRSMFNRNPLFDDNIFDGFFDSYQKKKATLTNTAQSLVIEPLPEENKPDGFSGAVGQFDFRVNAMPTEIRLGDPITLTMTITGKGNFDRVTAPPFPEGEDWKTYTATSSYKGVSGFQGEKVFEQAVVANSPSVKSIPPLHFNYFDPQKERYLTKSSQAIPLKLSGLETASAAAERPQPKSFESSAPAAAHAPGQSATMRLSPGKFVPDISPVYAKPWFILIIMVCSGVLLCLGAAALWQNYRGKNLNQLGKKRLTKEIHKHFEELERHLNNGNIPDFLTTCRRVIQLRFGCDWQVEPATLTLADLQERLQADSPLLKIFSAAEQQAYGGFDLAPEDLREYFELLKKEMEGVR